MLNEITINNISYNWEDIEIHFVGFNYNPTGVTSISYNTEHNIQYGYSRTGFPVSTKFGAYTSVASITLDYYEMNVLRGASFNFYNGIIATDIKIIFKGKDKDNIIIDTLYGCRINFTNNNYGGSQGDMNLTSTLNLNPVWIKLGTVPTNIKNISILENIL